ncbi:MAG TPA: DUF4388 domain-containing protein [Candidatus Dormibacteraeota bacterium]|nr:DUF4388 domain-containing protein [Candidatus Dormibacteraeota bacterium]
MQNQGSLGPTTVAELLQTMQQERATGTLSLASNGSQCSLHFLFGHLFHAVGGEAEGEPAVIDALGWRDGEYSFNPRAKLPPEETINSSTEDLLAIWRSGPEGQPAISAAEVTVTVDAAAASPASGEANDELESEDDDWLDAVATGEIAAEVDEPADIAPFQTPARAVPAVERGFSAPAPAAASTPVPTPRPTSRPPTNWPANRQTSTAAATAAEQTRPASTTRSGAVPPSGGGSTPPGTKPVAGATKSQLSVVIPMPSGASLHSGLKASFLNFPMLLRTLSQDGFSGYITITGEKDARNVGHILFREGAIIQAQQRSAGSYRRHKAALQEVVRGVGVGEGLIDAIEIPAALVESVGGLVVANTLFLQLPCRIVDFDALVEFVEEQSLTGGILVTSGQEQVSVVLMAEGRPKGSYSSDSQELTEGPGVAAAASGERESRIDVVAAPPGPLPAIDLAEIA